MSYSNANPAIYSSTNSSEGKPELNLYQAFIFAVPICFTFILLLLFYLFYLRRRSVDWSALRMRSTIHTLEISRAELGVKKEVREMLPIIIYKESFSVKDAQCAVCLGDYQAEDKLQQIPACGHAFHMYCIDRWLSCHTTCPLCRLSLISKPSPTQSVNNHVNAEASNAASARPSQETPSPQLSSESRNGDTRKEREKDDPDSPGTSDTRFNTVPD